MSHFSEITEQIQDIKKDFNSPLGGILKYIKGEGLFINEDFFGKDKKEITDNDIKEILEKIQKELENIKKLKQSLKHKQLSEVEKKFALNSLNIAGLKFIMFKSSVFLEAEKAGYKLSIKDRQKFLHNVNKLQNICYGPEISENIKESAGILSSLQNLLDKNTHKVSDDEARVFQEFIDSFNIPKIEIKENKEKNNLKDIFLTKEKFEQIFKMVLDLYQLDDWQISIENVDNFSVKKEKKLIVCPESKIETTHLKRILQLIDHEIGVHAVRGYNTNKTTKLNGEGYLEGEEGFATMTELLFDNTIEEITVLPTIHHISTFIAENRTGEKTKEILEIYFKLSGLSKEKAQKEALDKMLRVKRFVSLEEKGANRKDVSYTRGQSQVIDFFKNSNSKIRKEFLKDFYYSKLAIEDIGLIKEFRENLGIEESELKYPLWIGKILYKKLSGEKFFFESLKNEDFRFEGIEKLSFEIKRKIVGILKEIY